MRLSRARQGPAKAVNGAGDESTLPTEFDRVDDAIWNRLVWILQDVNQGDKDSFIARVKSLSEADALVARLLEGYAFLALANALAAQLQRQPTVDDLPALSRRICSRGFLEFTNGTEQELAVVLATVFQWSTRGAMSRVRQVTFVLVALGESLDDVRTDMAGLRPLIEQYLARNSSAIRTSLFGAEGARDR